MIKLEIMDTILKEHISIDKNSHFSADVFIDLQSHFLDIKFNNKRFFLRSNSYWTT